MLIVFQLGETHVFGGVETIAKEWECVLIYDEEQDVSSAFILMFSPRIVLTRTISPSQTYTLEKLDSYMTLRYDRKVASPERSNPRVSSNVSPFSVTY